LIASGDAAGAGCVDAAPCAAGKTWAAAGKVWAAAGKVWAAAGNRLMPAKPADNKAIEIGRRTEDR
jgi:hypothetical protein